MGARWFVGEGGGHPGEPCCLVYQLGSKVKDLVSGELINCLLSPSLPIDDAVFEPLRGGASVARQKREVRRDGQENNAAAAQRVYTCARVCAQTCMWH